MKKITKIIIVAVVIIAIAASVAIPVALNKKGYFAEGNDEKYSVAQTEEFSDSPIAGKKIIFLGSSVTYGSMAKGESFVDYLEKRDGIIPVKEAVSGTTLVNEGDDSYVARIGNIDRSLDAAAFICQLSTNDATKNMPLGEVGDGFRLEDFDTKTVAGAIEYIIVYAKSVWNCPVAFYTGTKYDSERYGEMVELLNEIAKKWDVYVIDMWNDEVMNDVTETEYALYMADGIHPTRAGYKLWWTPKFESYLYAKLQ